MDNDNSFLMPFHSNINPEENMCFESCYDCSLQILFICKNVIAKSNMSKSVVPVLNELIMT